MTPVAETDFNMADVNGSIPNTSTTTGTPNDAGGTGNIQTEWVMSHSCYVATLTLLSGESGVALLSNALLIMTIRYSPSLRTPPNSQLISICVNNLLVVLNMILSLVSLNISESTDVATLQSLDVLRDFQLFLTATSWLQYWCIFSAISYYRCTTLKRPSMSVRTRKTIIYRSIRIGWFLSILSGSMLTIAMRSAESIVNWNPFRQKLVSTGVEPLSPYQSLVLLLIVTAFIAGGAVLVSSYYRIFRMLYINRPLCQNRVYPLVRTASISSVENDLTMAVHPNYRPSIAFPSPTPFTISGSAFADNNFTVHFHKQQHSVAMEIFALENPIRAHGYATVSQRHRPLQKSTSNGSNVFHSEFTDISPTGELQRVQRCKTSFALRNQSMRRDRLSLGGATKNSLVMLCTYFLFSCPMVICAIPGVVSTDNATTLSFPLLAAKLIFFINSPAYPIWYLVFSRRVRKCLSRLWKHAKVKCGFRA